MRWFSSSIPRVGGRCLRGLVRRRGASFFICQAHAAQGVVHRGDTAVQVAGAGDFGQGCAGMFQNDPAHLLPLFCRQERFASHAGIEVVDGSDGFPLVKQLLDEAQGNAEACGNGLLGGVVLVARRENANAKVERDGLH